MEGRKEGRKEERTSIYHRGGGGGKRSKFYLMVGGQLDADGQVPKSAGVSFTFAVMIF